MTDPNQAVPDLPDDPFPDETGPSPDPDSPAAFGEGGGDDDSTMPNLGGAAGGADKLLTQLLKLRPMLGLWESTGSGSTISRGLCFLIDGLFRILIVAMLLAVIGCVAWKAIMPLPPLHTAPPVETTTTTTTKPTGR